MSGLALGRLLNRNKVLGGGRGIGSDGSRKARIGGKSEATFDCHNEGVVGSQGRLEDFGQLKGAPIHS